MYNIKPVKQMDQAMIVLLSTTNDMSCTATFNTCCSLSIMDCGIGVPGCWGSSKQYCTNVFDDLYQMIVGSSEFDGASRSMMNMPSLTFS